MPSTRSDLDHHHRYAPEGAADSGQGTRTSAASLTPRSERCHAAKHHPHWTVIGHGDGTSTWTSPTGQQIRTRSSVRGLLPRPKPWTPQPWTPQPGQPTTGRAEGEPPTAYDRPR